VRIVLPSHNPGRSRSIRTQGDGVTDGRGVYGNVVRDNVADDNGTNKAPPQFGGWQRLGIGLFGSAPARPCTTTSSSTTRRRQRLPVAMHAHKPGGEDIDGNVIVHNDFGTTMWWRRLRRSSGPSTSRDRDRDLLVVLPTWSSATKIHDEASGSG